MANPFSTNGMFSWFELICDDTKQAKAFYSEVISWEFETDSNNPAYTLVKTKGSDHPIAGILPKSELMIENKTIPSHWGCYVTVTDIEKRMEKAKELGGTIIVPCTPIPKVGTFCVIQDPQGAVISLMEYDIKSVVFE